MEATVHELAVVNDRAVLRVQFSFATELAFVPVAFVNFLAQGIVARAVATDHVLLPLARVLITLRASKGSVPLSHSHHV